MVDRPLASALSALVEDGGDGNVLIARRGPAFFVCRAARGDRSILVEAAPSSYLPKGRGLSPNKVARLRAAGFASRPGHKALAKHCGLDAMGAISDIAQMIHNLFADAFSEPEGPDLLDLQLGEADRTENPLLIDAMRTMARKREHRYRAALYRTLLDSKLLLLVEAPPDASAAHLPANNADARPLKVDELMGFEVFAAFTSLAALRRYDIRGRPYKVVPGRALFAELLSHKVGSLLLDSRSPVGGELYRNEIETLAGASFRRGLR